MTLEKYSVITKSEGTSCLSETLMPQKTGIVLKSVTLVFDLDLGKKL